MNQPNEVFTYSLLPATGDDADDGTVSYVLSKLHDQLDEMSKSGELVILEGDVPTEPYPEDVNEYIESIKNHEAEVSEWICAGYGRAYHESNVGSGSPRFSKVFGKSPNGADLYIDTKQGGIVREVSPEELAAC